MVDSSLMRWNDAYVTGRVYTPRGLRVTGCAWLAIGVIWAGEFAFRFLRDGITAWLAFYFAMAAAAAALGVVYLRWAHRAAVRAEVRAESHDGS